MMPLCTIADEIGHVRMGVGLGRRAVGRPAGMADAGGARKRLGFQPQLEIAQLALGAAAAEMAVVEVATPAES